ncbi:MAG: flagellar export chaperone FliS [Oscillospiraceae bacterium]|nr:flagellar export chaperone FliS [Oscillospiraceae bacterium]
MASVNPMQQYQEQVLNTATPGMVTVMLFDEAAKDINLAIRAINEQNVQISHDSIVKAQNIYLALNGFLNDKFEISKSLSKLYDYLARRLMEANIKKNITILKEVLSFTLEFRDTWKQAEKNIHMRAK